jgi:chemotaxis protein CheC
MPLLIDVRKLNIINQLIRNGAENVAGSLSTMAGVDATVEIKSISFVDPSDIPAEMGDGELFGASIRLTEPPYGIFMMTLDTGSAAEIAGLMTGTEVDGELNQMQESALQEVCNITTSGFIDGIANTLETTIAMQTPELRQATGDELAEDTLSHVRKDSLSIVLDSVVDIQDAETDFSLRIFLVPDPGAFVNLVDKIDLDTVSVEDRAEDLNVE